MTIRVAGPGPRAADQLAAAASGDHCYLVDALMKKRRQSRYARYSWCDSPQKGVRCGTEADGKLSGQSRCQSELSVMQTVPGFCGQNEAHTVAT